MTCMRLRTGGAAFVLLKKVQAGEKFSVCDDFVIKSAVSYILRHTLYLTGKDVMICLSTLLSDW